jgi:hypothetical protein
MAQAFRIDKKPIDKYSGSIRGFTRKFNKAAGLTLNDFAFGSREQSYRYIESNMIVRSPGFVKRSLWAERATFADGLDKMQSKMGSIRRDRFTGWREQIEGSQMPRDRAITVGARGGSKRRRVGPQARLRPGKSWRRPDQYKARTARNRANAMIQALDQEGYRQPFLVYGHRTLSSGLWKFKGGRKGRRKLIALQLFNKTANVRRRPWMTTAVKWTFKKYPPGRTFARHAKRAFKQKK